MLLKDIETLKRLQIMFMCGAFILLIMQKELVLLLCSSILEEQMQINLKQNSIHKIVKIIDDYLI